MTIRLVAILGILLVFAAGVVWIHRDGNHSEIIKIERQNNAAGDASDQARFDYSRCGDDGGVYDFGALKCPRAAPRGRSDLVGARGATDGDQRKIDRTVVGICAAKMWTRDECRKHGAGG